MNAWPIFAPQDSVRDLADHPNQVQLVHGAAGLVYPAPQLRRCGVAHDSGPEGVPPHLQRLGNDL